MTNYCIPSSINNSSCIMKLICVEARTAPNRNKARVDLDRPTS